MKPRIYWDKESGSYRWIYGLEESGIGITEYIFFARRLDSFCAKLNKKLKEKQNEQ